MSSTQEGSGSVGATSQKTERNRRSWTHQEEATLIASLKELIVQGWKSDNGFRAGYLGKLEMAMKSTYPGTDLKSLPHINSKLQSWKKSYNSLTSMLSQSGVGFNLHGNHMIDCEDHQWEIILKADSNAKLMRYKSWPFFEDWKVCFGKDRATGENAEDIFEAWTDLRRTENVLPNRGSQGDLDESFENDVNEVGYDQVTHSARDDQQSKRIPKKRKLNEDLQEICILLSEMTQSTNSRLEHLANRIGYEFDMGKARQETFEQLGDIPGLSLENRFFVCELVAFKAERLDIWRGMKQEARAQYVQHLLNNRGA